MEFAKESNAKRTIKRLQVLDKRLQGYKGMIKFVLLVVISVELEVDNAPDPKTIENI